MVAPGTRGSGWVEHRNTGRGEAVAGSRLSAVQDTGTVRQVGGELVWQALSWEPLPNS